MQVVFLKDVKNVARRGEVKDVKDGYARNYLIPQGLAEIASKSKIQEIESKAEKKKQEKQKEREEMEKLTKQLKDMTLEFKKKADDAGSLFGSVSADDIIKAINKRTGKYISESSVKLGQPIKKIGEYTIDLNLKHGIKTQAKVVVKSDT